VSGLALAAGYAADLIAGDPRRLHPVAGFGQAAAAAERSLYAPTRTRGLLVTALLVAGAAAATEAAARIRPGARGVTMAVATWAALGGRSLRQEASHVGSLIEAERLDQARDALRALCGRDAATLDDTGILRGVIESVAENTSDAVVAALLWGAVAGPAGVVGYRAANTLDAMFGHRDARYAEFGFTAAKLDDLLSWPAARLTVALTVGAAPFVGCDPATALAAATSAAAASHPSPNAGIVEAAFAGALGLRLGGPLSYEGGREERPFLGEGRPPVAADVRRANRLSLAVCTLAALLCGLARSVR
jgi:adenosylcobinamide-phosphate synthase